MSIAPPPHLMQQRFCVAMVTIDGRVGRTWRADPEVVSMAMLLYRREGEGVCGGQGHVVPLMGQQRS